MHEEIEQDGAHGAADPFKVAFGRRMRELRSAKVPPLTQERLGQQLAVKKANISQWESGSHTPKLEALSALCDVLECSADYLLGRNYHGFSAEALEEARVYDTLAPDDKRKWRAMRRAMFVPA